MAPYFCRALFATTVAKKMGHNQDIFRAVVLALQADLNGRLHRLAAAASQRDRVTATTEARALKGALGEVTATSAAYLASILERAAEAMDWETFDLAFSEFQTDANQLRGAINEYLGLKFETCQSPFPALYPTPRSPFDQLH
jgi:hypothetical protein